MKNDVSRTPIVVSQTVIFKGDMASRLLRPMGGQLCSFSLQPTARAKTPEIWRLHNDGVGATEIAKRLGISRASVYRALNMSA